jgi:hypothetical protein
LVVEAPFRTSLKLLFQVVSSLWTSWGRAKSVLMEDSLDRLSRTQATSEVDALPEALMNIATRDGRVQPCQITYSVGSEVTLTASSSVFGELRYAEANLFDALIKFRLHLEKIDYFLLCNAARKDTYPSRAIKQMGGAFRVYVLHAGQQANPADLVDALGPATLDKIATVDEQRAAYEDWLRSLR